MLVLESYCQPKKIITEVMKKEFFVETNDFDKFLEKDKYDDTK